MAKLYIVTPNGKDFSDSEIDKKMSKTMGGLRGAYCTSYDYIRKQLLMKQLSQHYQ